MVSIYKRSCRIYALFLVLVFTMFPLAANKCEMWYEDNNLGKKAYFPPDAREKFIKPDTWERSRKKMDNYMIRINVFSKRSNKLDKYFMKYKMFKLLKRDGVHLTLDVLGGTLTHANIRKEETKERELRMISKIESMGMPIDSIVFQSALSKSIKIIRRRRSVFKDEYPMDQRIVDICDYAEKVHKKFPNIRFGIIDALPTKGLPYKQPYLSLKKSMSERGLRLDFIILDMSHHVLDEGWRGMDWNKLKEIDNYIHDELHVKFGKTFDDRIAGKRSDKDYYLSVARMANEFKTRGIQSDICAFMSWFPHPRYTIPETKQYTMTYDFLKLSDILTR